MNDVIDALAVALTFTPVAGILATIFLWKVYLSDTARPRSWVLFMFAAGSTIVSAAGAAISLIAIVRLSGESIGLAGGLVLAGVLLVLEWVPIWYALTVFRRRRTARVDESHIISEQISTSSESH